MFGLCAPGGDVTTKGNNSKWETLRRRGWAVLDDPTSSVLAKVRSYLTFIFLAILLTAHLSISVLLFDDQAVGGVSRGLTLRGWSGGSSFSQ